MLFEPIRGLLVDGHRDFRAAVPRLDDSSLLDLAGNAEVAVDEIDILADGHAYGSLSMTSTSSSSPLRRPPTSCGANDRRHPASRPTNPTSGSATVSVDLAAGLLPAGTRSRVGGPPARADSATATVVHTSPCRRRRAASLGHLGLCGPTLRPGGQVSGVWWREDLRRTAGPRQRRRSGEPGRVD